MLLFDGKYYMNILLQISYSLHAVKIVYLLWYLYTMLCVYNGRN